MPPSSASATHANGPSAADAAERERRADVALEGEQLHEPPADNTPEAADADA